MCVEAVIFGCWYDTDIAFLWCNVVSCAAVVVAGLAVTAADRRLPSPGYRQVPS